MHDIVSNAFELQVDAGWMGFWQTLAGCTAGLIIARYSNSKTSMHECILSRISVKVKQYGPSHKMFAIMKHKKLFLIIIFLYTIGYSIGYSAWFPVLVNQCQMNASVS